MRFFLNCVIVHFKRLLDLRFVVIFVFSVFFVLGANLLVGGYSHDISKVKIGVLYENKEIDGLLNEYTNENLEFVCYTNKTDLEKDVIDRKLELAYVFADDEITKYITDFTMLDSVTDFAVASEMMKNKYEEIAQSALGKYFEHNLEFSEYVIKNGHTYLSEITKLKINTYELKSDGVTNLVSENNGLKDILKIFPVILSMCFELAFFVMTLFSCLRFENKQKLNVYSLIYSRKRTTVIFVVSGISVALFVSAVAMSLYFAVLI